MYQLVIPEPAVPLIKRWEGFAKVIQRRPVVLAGPYLCPARVWTIGYGTVVDTPDYPPITLEDAEELLMGDLYWRLAGVYQLCPVLMREPEHRAAAVLSFAYNLGLGALKTSTLRSYVLEENWAEAADEFDRWVWAGGRKLAGLIARRTHEARVFRGDV